jgi:hypothetical protein
MIHGLRYFDKRQPSLSITHKSEELPVVGR